MAVMDILPPVDRTALHLCGIGETTWFVAHRERRRDRLLARLRAQALDEQLARGLSPDDGRARSVRAATLVSPRTRARIARRYERVLERAYEPVRMRDPRVPIPRGRIVAAADLIREVVVSLRAQRPAPARGVAMASLLVQDGAGPLFDVRRAAPDLRQVLRGVVDGLDPLAELLTAPPP
jgi:hypothetical protein